MVTWLRIIVSCFCLTFFVLLTWLWVRSYFNTDTAARISGFSQFEIHSHLGILSFDLYTGTERRLNAATTPAYQFRRSNAAGMRDSKGILGFYWRSSGPSSWGFSHTEFTLPLWPLIWLFGLPAFFIRPKPRWQFGLRDIMLFLTMFGLAFGAITSLIRVSGIFTG
jgi:hypothetical protein